MRFENAFVVGAPIEEVWSTLLDVERVAPCVPGAEVLERSGEDEYRVAIKVRVGPIAMTYRGELRIVERDDAAHTATMLAKAREARGQGAADANVRMTLAEAPDGTHASLETEVALSGRVAAMGQGVIGDVSARLVEAFAGNLATMLAVGAANGNGAGPAGGEAGTQAPSAEPQAVTREDSLRIGGIAAGVIGRRLSDPRTLAAVALGYALVFAALGFLRGRSRPGR